MLKFGVTEGRMERQQGVFSNKDSVANHAIKYRIIPRIYPLNRNILSLAVRSRHENKLENLDRQLPCMAWPILNT